MKTEEIFFIVLVEVATEYGDIDETLREMEEASRFFMTNTPGVKVMASEILTTKTRNPRNRDLGTQS